MVDEENEEICILNEFVDDIDIDKNKIISWFFPKLLIYNGNGNW
jgi:hypothetical protein